MSKSVEVTRPTYNELSQRLGGEASFRRDPLGWVMDKVFPVSIYDAQGEVKPTITERPLGVVTRVVGGFTRDVAIPVATVAALPLVIYPGSLVRAGEIG